MQNASDMSKQDSLYQVGECFPSQPIENEYENVEIHHSSRPSFLPVLSPHRNCELSHPNPPNPTPSSRPTSSSACFYIFGNKHINHYDQDQFESHTKCNYHCHNHFDYAKDDNHFCRPVFFSPQPQKPEFLPTLNSKGNQKLRQSVKRAVSDSQAKIKMTRNRNRNPLLERKKCFVESEAEANNERG